MIATCAARAAERFEFVADRESASRCSRASTRISGSSISPTRTGLMSIRAGGRRLCGDHVLVARADRDRGAAGRDAGMLDRSLAQFTAKSPQRPPCPPDVEDHHTCAVTGSIHRRRCRRPAGHGEADHRAALAPRRPAILHLLADRTGRLREGQDFMASWRLKQARPGDLSRRSAL